MINDRPLRIVTAVSPRWSLVRLGLDDRSTEASLGDRFRSPLLWLWGILLLVCLLTITVKRSPRWSFENSGLPSVPTDRQDIRTFSYPTWWLPHVSPGDRLRSLMIAQSSAGVIAPYFQLTRWIRPWSGITKKVVDQSFIIILYSS